MKRGTLTTVDRESRLAGASRPRAEDVRGTFRQVDDGCVFHVPAPSRAGQGGERARHCAVHTTLGHDALPASCQHFPRVCLIDDRGVRVSLSHYCPTAAAMLVDDGRPVTIVNGPPPVPSRAVPEGLDVRGELPPRLTGQVLMDLDGLTAWEAHVVAVLAGPAAIGSPEQAVARLAADAKRLAAWSPASGTSLVDAVAALDTVGRDDDLTAAAAVIADSRTWPAWFERAASTCRGAWLVDGPPAALAELDARHVTPVWERHVGPVRRYLAARAFGSWISYQADAAVSLAAWLTLCHAVLRIEIARACGGAGRPLDRDLLVQAIRQSDLSSRALRRHLVAIADALRTIGSAWRPARARRLMASTL